MSFISTSSTLVEGFDLMAKCPNEVVQRNQPLDPEEARLLEELRVIWQTHVRN